MAISFSRIIPLLSLVIVGALSSACSDVNFSAVQKDSGSPGANPLTNPPSTCTDVESIYRQTKILFLVDASGSNVQTTANQGSNGCGTHYCTPPTDPQKEFRGGAIGDFFRRYRHKTNFDWSFAVFQGTSAFSLIQGGNNQNPVFASKPTPMGYAIQDFYGIEDKGATPYKAALALAKRAVQADPDLNAPSKPNYFIILLTDGFPTDYYDQNGSYDSQALSRDVDSLLGVAPGQVSLSTIYYGQFNDPNAITLLRGMASKGSGQFASVNDPNSGFRIDDIIPGTQPNCR